MKIYNILLSLVCTLFLFSELSAQIDDTPRHTESLSIDFGINQGAILRPLIPSDDQPDLEYPESSYITITRIIKSTGQSPWVQVHFDNVNLGENSFLTIRSLEDNDIQRFDAKSIIPWRNWSAIFKGGMLEAILHVAPNEKNISLKAVELLVGDFQGGAPINSKSPCGPTDDRSQSSLPMRDARLMPLGCTGWNHAGGFYATAGHCLNVGVSSLSIMEFYVPASLCDGTKQPAAVVNQYPIIYSSRVWQENGIGDDWGFYNVGPNSNSGLTAVEAQRSYYHMTKANPTANIQIRGFGTDNDPLGCNGGRNADNQTLQWHAGPNLGETITTSNDIYWEYQADTEGGNSGSSIRSTSNPDLHHAIGIHTHAGCGTTTGNHGTSFEADDTEAAMNTYWQTQVEYVDVDHHLSNVTGTLVWPHYLLQNALNQANAGHGPGDAALEIILIAGSNRNTNSTTETGGVYAESINYSGATHGVILRRTVGAVRIGPNATAPIIFTPASQNGLLEAAE